MQVRRVVGTCGAAKNAGRQRGRDPLGLSRSLVAKRVTAADERATHTQSTGRFHERAPVGASLSPEILG